MSSILVTGSNGFVGKILCAKLKSFEHTAFGFDTSDGDIAVKGSLDKFSHSGITHVFHLAARSFVPESWQDPYEFYRVNFLGTVNVLEFCRSTGASLTYVSSYLYGSPDYLPVDENHPLKPFNPYSHTKILADETCRFYQQIFKVPVTVIRPFNVYGPGQDKKFLIPKIIGQLLDPDKKEIEVIDLRPKRDYLYVDDLNDALILTITRQGGVYNLGSGSSASVGDLTSILSRITGITKPIVTSGEIRPVDIMDLYADISCAKAELGWEPKVTLEEGLGRITSDLI